MTAMRERFLSLASLVAAVDGTLLNGEGAAAGSAAGFGVSHLRSPASAARGEADPKSAVVFSNAAEYAQYALASSDDAPASPDEARPGVVIVGREVEEAQVSRERCVVQVADPRLALAKLSALLSARPVPLPGRHSSAVIAPSATVADDAAIGAGVVIADGAVVGPGTTVHANSVIGEGARVGAGCVIHPNVTVYDGVLIGDRVILHAGVVLGADGFGYAASPTGAVKIHHGGGVRIADDVEIGANTAVDRGTLDDTVVGTRTKIDNLCQVGHNVVIGSDCLVAGTAAIGGSVSIGNGVIIGGNVAIADHVTIGDGARLAGRSGVTKDVPAGETWAGFPARPYRSFARSLYLADKVEEMWAYVRQRKAQGG